MNKMKYSFFLLAFIFCLTNVKADNLILHKVDTTVNNQASLQRGARIFFNYCQGCHDIKYIRYSEIAKGIGLKEEKNKSLETVIQEKLMHRTNNINENDYVLSSIIKNDGIKWFGKAPPDLSLVSRYKGNDWLYTYMKSFYKDSSKTWGVNNLLFPDVGMPHVLINLQGLQILKTNKNQKKMFEIIQNGELSVKEYNKLITDLVSFLSFIGEPSQTEREQLGYVVLIFLITLMVLLFFLKKEYWKDIK